MKCVQNLRRSVKALQLRQLWLPIPIERCEVAKLEILADAAASVSASYNCQHFVELEIVLSTPA